MPELPPPLPPEERTVGQLIAESIRAYGQDFWRCVPLGLPFAIVDQASTHHSGNAQVIIYWAATPLFVAAYLWACHLVLNARPNRTAVAVAVLIWLPFPVLRALYLLPGLAWFALIGLAVPVAMLERTGFRESLVRGRRLGLAAYAHAFGSLCGLTIVAAVASQVLSALLQSQSEAGLRVALLISDVVLSPLLYLGAALLYVDQSARAARAASTSDALGLRDAGVHPPVDAEPAGGADAQVEP
jgi:hypothetical protein